MKIDIKGNEGFVKFKMKDDGRVTVDYGYNIASTLAEYASGEIDEVTASRRITVVALVAGVATNLRANLDSLVEAGADALDAGFLDDNEHLYTATEELTDEQIELLYTETEGNA